MDLRVAIERGFVVLPVRGSGGVDLVGRVLRYDPTLAREVRCRLVMAALEKKAAS